VFCWSSLTSLTNILGAQRPYITLSPTFSVEWKAEFQSEVSENIVLIFPSSKFTKPMISIHWALKGYGVPKIRTTGVEGTSHFLVRYRNDMRTGYSLFFMGLGSSLKLGASVKWGRVNCSLLEPNLATFWGELTTSCFLIQNWRFGKGIRV